MSPPFGLISLPRRTVMPFYDPNALKSKEIAPGAHIQPLWGDKVMMVFITLEPGRRGPEPHPPQ